MTAAHADLERFLRGEIDPACFPHREHVRMAFAMLQRFDFVESALHYSRALRELTARAGRPEAFHQTVTIAFLALIAERLESGKYADFEAFARANPEVLGKSALRNWYTAARLDSQLARRTFVLPDRVGLDFG